MRRAALLVIVGIAAASCPATAPEPGPEVPAGWTLRGDPAALQPLADGLVSLEGTPAARYAPLLRERLEDEGPTGSVAWSWRDDAVGIATGTLETSAGGGAPGEAEAGDGAGSGATVGGLSVTAMFTPAGDWGGATFLPAGDGPGAPALSTDGALVHVRLRADGGLDLAGLVPAGSEADTMLGLKSDVLSGAVLDGTFEAALYTPAPGATMPPMVMAAGYRIRAVAERGLDAMAANIEATYGVPRVPVTVGDVEATCFPTLRVLPETGPCGAVTDGAIVIAYNEVSLRRALAEPADDNAGFAADAEAASILRFDLADLPAADRSLVEARLRAAGGDPAGAREPTVWPWAAATLTGRRDGDAHRFELELEGRVR